MSPAQASVAEQAPGLEVVRQGPELQINFRRPGARNAITQEMLAVLNQTLAQAARDDDLRVISVTGDGDHFCAGMDLVASNPSVREAAGLPEGDGAAPARPRVTARHRSMDNGPHRFIELLLAIEVPVVTRVRGTAAGLGFALMLASDFAVVSDSSRFVAPYVRRGFTPDSGLSYMLPQLVGVARAKEILMRGRSVDVTEAEAWGLITGSVPDAEADMRFREVVDELGSGPTVALGLTKWLLNQDALEGLAAGMRRESVVVDLSLRTKDFKEGISAFLAKRDPDFSGR